MKSIIKTESVAAFLARGGQIKKVPMNMGKRFYRKVESKIVQLENQVDMSALPEPLKIKYGIK